VSDERDSSDLPPVKANLLWNFFFPLLVPFPPNFLSLQFLPYLRAEAFFRYFDGSSFRKDSCSASNSSPSPIPDPCLPPIDYFSTTFSDLFFSFAFPSEKTPEFRNSIKSESFLRIHFIPSLINSPLFPKPDRFSFDLLSRLSQSLYVRKCSLRVLLTPPHRFEIRIDYFNS